MNDYDKYRRRIHKDVVKATGTDKDCEDYLVQPGTYAEAFLHCMDDGHFNYLEKDDPQYAAISLFSDEFVAENILFCDDERALLLKILDHGRVAEWMRKEGWREVRTEKDGVVCVFGAV